jgi:multisubunit Na+/H+ antiporter MnhC subunit
MNPNRPARLNRTVLAVLGLLLLLTGAFVFLVGSGAAPTVTARLPVRADVPMLPDGFVAPAWLPWVGVAAAVVVGLAALGWLVAQTARAPATGTWQLADDPRGGTTELDTATAAAPLAEEISTYAGVRAATARLAGAHQHPQLHMRVTAEDGASLPDLRHRIDELAVPRLVGALDLPALDADLVLRLTGR